MNGKMINEYDTTTMQPSELNIVVQPVVQGTDPNNAQFEKGNLGELIDQQTDDRFNEDEAIVAALDGATCGMSRTGMTVTSGTERPGGR